jgi:hypothetical protein
VRRRIAAAAALGLCAVVVGAVVVAASSGEERAGAAWAGQPLLLRPPELPKDRIVSGRIRNTGLRNLELDAADVAVIDATGRRTPASARFLGQFAHGLYPPLQGLGPGGEGEQRRLGMLARVRPGQSVPFTAAWRGRGGAPEPRRVDLGEVSVPVPTAVRSAG